MTRTRFAADCAAALFASYLAAASGPVHLFPRLGFEDFDCWVVENDIPDEGRPEGLACWLSGQKGSGRAVRFEKVELGHEQILEGQEQRDLDAVPSFLALRDDEDAG